MLNTIKRPIKAKWQVGKQMQFYPPYAGSALYLPGYPPMGTTIIDHSGNANVCTLAGGATWTRSPKGIWGIDFDGATGVIQVTDATSIQNIFNAGGTLKLWANLDSSGEDQLGAFCQKGINIGFLLRCYYQTGNNMALECRADFTTTDGIWYTTSKVVPISTYKQIIATYDGSLTTNVPIIYLNGVSQTLTTTSTPVGTIRSDVGQNLIFGAQDAAGTRAMDGRLYLIEAVKGTIWTATQALASFNQERHLFNV